MTNFRIIYFENKPVGTILSCAVPSVDYADELVKNKTVTSNDKWYNNMSLKQVLYLLNHAFNAADIVNTFTNEKITQREIFDLFQNRYNELSFSEEEETDYTDDSVFYIVIGNYTKTHFW